MFSRFLSSTNLDAVIAADKEVRNEIESLARSQLERRGDKRSLEDKLKIAAESNHLVKAFQTSEGQRLMRKAELKSAQVGSPLTLIYLSPLFFVLFTFRVQDEHCIQTLLEKGPIFLAKKARDEIALAYFDLFT